MNKFSRMSMSIALALTATAGLVQANEGHTNIEYTEAGIPLLETNPAAPIAVYLDFDGGIYGSGKELLSGYNRSIELGGDGDPLTFDALEQQDIINAVNNMDEYFAMFDVNITTSLDVMQQATAASWVIITEEYGGGLAHLGGSGISTNQTHAKAYSSAGRSRIESDNRNRTLASEVAHNFGLLHQGECTNGQFTKLVYTAGFDHQRGAIMGSGGGIVNGWRYGDHDGRNSCVGLQDDIAMIQQKILTFAPADYTGDGFRADDHSQARDEFATPLVQQNDASYSAQGSIERMTDKDTFAINWSGGDMHVQATPKGVSSVDVIAKLYDDQDNLIEQVDSDNINIEYLYAQGLVAGTYYVEIMSHGDYGQLGPYNLLVQDESAGPPSSGRLEVKINSSTDDAEENTNGGISRAS